MLKAPGHDPFIGPALVQHVSWANTRLVQHLEKN
jgi:hypothetical protein